MAEPYDLRSNLKNKPGAQGTLFQVKDKGLLNPQQRWPQGYTPERLNEVREGLKHVPVSAPDHFYSQPSDETQKMHGVNEYGLRERVTREIAKTTVPGEHLRGLKDLHTEPDEGTHGTYWKGGARDRTLGTDLLSDRTPDEQRKTLVHEIGHHVNMTLSPTPHVHTMVAQLHAQREAETPSTYGGQFETYKPPTQTDVAMKRSVVAPSVDEAQADDYAVKHFRTGGRKSKTTTTGAYEDTYTPSERERKYPGYNDVREPQPSPTLHAMQQAQFQPGLFSKERGNQSELRKRLAHADATRNAVGENLK